MIYRSPLLVLLFFAVDVTQAGAGQLEIMVNRGALPNTVKMLREGVYLVSFVPQDTQPHIVDVKFNGQLLPREFNYTLSSTANTWEELLPGEFSCSHVKSADAM